MAQKTKVTLFTELDNWKLNSLDPVISNPAPLISPDNVNAVFTDFKNIVKDVVDSAKNETTVLTISSVTGLQAALDAKENADINILKQSQVVDNLLSTSISLPLSANQGRVLKTLIDGLHQPNTDTKLAQGTANEVTATALRTHLDNNSVHFTQAAIDHTVILNRGSYTHAQIDSHILDTSIHYPQTAIDHLNILNRGSNTHAQIDAHIAATNNPHGTTFAQVLTASSIPSTKGFLLAGNGSTYVTLSPGVDGTVLKANSAQPTGLEWTSDIGEVNIGTSTGTGSAVYNGKSGVTLQFRRLNSLSSILTIAENGGSVEFNVIENNINHQNLNGAGSNTHAQIDAHIANTSIHREINDSTITLTQLWSSSKINTEITSAKNVDNHVNGAVNGVFTQVEKTKLANIDTTAMTNAALTSFNVAGVPAYSTSTISSPTSSTPFGFVSLAEAASFIQKVANMETRLNEIIAKLT